MERFEAQGHGHLVGISSVAADMSVGDIPALPSLEGVRHAPLVAGFVPDVVKRRLFS